MRLEKITFKLIAWLKIARLQFYVMTWIAYSLGTAVAYRAGLEFDFSVYVLGYLLLFFIEFATVLTNEYYDFESDRINQNIGPFNGGSRTLVEGVLSFREVKIAIFVSLTMIFITASLLLVFRGNASILSVTILAALGVILGIGYTVPPLQFSYHGLGEIVVGITHSAYVILCGFVFQGGIWTETVVWALSIPLFFSTVAAITLSGIPDCRADRRAGKNTLSVVFGPRRASIFSIACILLAAFSSLLLFFSGLLPEVFRFLNIIVIPHAILTVFAIIRLIRGDNYEKTINPIMILSLMYILWFGLIPFILLLVR